MAPDQHQHQHPGDHPSAAAAAAEQAPLLGGGDGAGAEEQRGVPARIARGLYLSHFLSTWNSRVFEFGAVLYLATVYPGTLLPLSAYALARGLSAVLLASAVGRYIDTGDRLRVVRVSIVFQRLVVAASCAVFYIMLVTPGLDERSKTGMLVILSFLACVEKLCSIMNLVSVEKDWVVVIAGQDHGALGALNAQMRRIDLLCKLIGPLFIALLDGVSTKAAVVVNLAMNVASVVLEYDAIARVYREVPALQEPKQQQHPGGDSSSTTTFSGTWARCQTSVGASFRRYRTDLGLYFHHKAFLPSFAGALLYLTVLSFGGQMVTYLLSTGYTSSQIGATRTLGVAFEVVATWVAPALIGKIGPLRAGLWLSNLQVSMLITGLVIFWVFGEIRPIVSASGLVGGVILSRLGLRGFDLCTQIIVQEEVEAENRGAFSSVEAAWQNAFELLAYGSTIMFSQPSQFKWPSLLSVAAVTCASLSYTVYVYLRRGHLIHPEKLARLCASKEDRAGGVERGLGNILARGEI